MSKNILFEKIFEAGKQNNIDEMEIYTSQTGSFKVSVFEGEIDSYKVSNSQGLSLRGNHSGKMGYSYTEKVDETSIDLLVKNVLENAEIVDSEDEMEIQAPSKNYESIELYNSNLENVDVKEKIDLVMNIEKIAKQLDERVKAVSRCVFGYSYSNIQIKNTKNIDLEEKSNLGYVYVAVMVKDGEDVKTGSAYKVSNNFADFDASELAKEAVEEAVSLLGAETVDSKEYTILLRNDASADMLEAFEPIFSAENVQKGTSLLKGQIGEKIASEKLTIVEDPHLKGGAASTAFDGEGIATKYKEVVSDGVLKTYFYNSKTAKKDGVKSTGNGHKGSYKSSIGTLSTNMYIKPGKKSAQELIKGIKEGIFVIGLDGLHSGLNTISGDFSLAARGFLIEDGKIIRPVNQITVAGNYFEMLKEIEEVGNDLKFVLPDSNHIGSPTIKISKLSVSGK